MLHNRMKLFLYSFHAMSFHMLFLPIFLDFICSKKAMKIWRNHPVNLSFIKYVPK